AMSPLKTSILLLALFLPSLLSTVDDALGSPRIGSSSPDSGNHSSKCQENTECEEGVILPVWLPQNPSVGDKVARAIVYFVALIYMFLGMSIIADRFMASIEVITSQEKEITIKKPNGETTTTTIRIWNETVSNLTLMALGSSAPEILLSIIEIVGHGFHAGDMGPSTIVGSAAFNMFIIIAICIHVVPQGEVRRIKHLRVFFVTAAWSIFAYIWLYLILAWFSPGEVELWEALLTFLFFPLCVLQAWVGDIGYPKMDIEMDNSLKEGSEGLGDMGKDQDEEARRDMARTLRDLKQKYPEKDMEQLIEMANYQVLVQQQKSRAFYRIQATRMMIGAGNILKKHAADQARKAISMQEVQMEEDESVTRVGFEPAHYQCFENCGSVVLTVARRGGDLACVTVRVDFRTEDGTANAGSDYEFAEGTLLFKPGETHKELRVGIIDDDIFEEDEYFYVHLSNVRAAWAELGPEPPPKACLSPSKMATVTIFDDDHAGIFTFEGPSKRVNESVGVVHIKVLRTSGARGRVAIPYHTIEGTAKAGEDYEEVAGKVEFQNDETIKIIDDEEYEKNKNFHLELGPPVILDIGLRHGKDRKMKKEEIPPSNFSPRPLQRRPLFPHPILGDTNENQLPAGEQENIAKMGYPSLGENAKLESTVDKLIKKTNLALVVGSSSWREQFVSAVTVSAGDDEDDDSGEDRLPSCFDYIMHFLTVFWKVLFAFVPPTEYWCGWACFLVSICLIGVLTALTGDLASHFGCTIGLKDSVTAVVFVALGTSVPDTFASKVAAIQDQYADASIGNVTGSNAVNVFLGIGVAWTIAASYWASQGKPFEVQPGTLAFSVTLFTIFAFISIAVLLYRRRPPVGGELGGPRTPKLLSTLLFISLWLVYILLAALEAYCHIEGF
uniref:Calx-beta domain-containing protein n=1 Tax=Naja naja TaxID=35670 RepID=A0A8C6XIH1_NAJNA